MNQSDCAPGECRGWVGGVGVGGVGTCPIRTVIIMLFYSAASKS